METVGIIISYAVGGFVLLLVTWVVSLIVLRIKSGSDIKKNTLIHTLAMGVVSSVQQQLEGNSGGEKFRKAIDELQSRLQIYGIKLDNKVLSSYIEQAVLEFKKLKPNE